VRWWGERTVVKRAIIVNTWPTKSTPDIVQPLPFAESMTITEAISLLRHARDVPQPTNTPLPPTATIQLPRYFIIEFNGLLTIRGIKRNLQPTKWYAIFDVSSVIEHGYWHPRIVDDLLATLEPLTK
jgi:hypothetical protein